MSFFEHFQIWLGAFLVLSIFSFLYKDNPFYKLVEYIYAGLSAGYYIGLVWQSVIIQQLVDPMFDNGSWWLIFPGFLGLLMFTRFYAKWSWISRISLAFIMGNTAGIFLISPLHGIILPQVKSTMLSLNPGQGFVVTLLTLVVVIGVISTLIYFYFSKEHKGAMGAVAKLGIWFIMISFGAHFGYTVMARISLLIGQIHFLLFQWGGSISQIF